MKPFSSLIAFLLFICIPSCANQRFYDSVDAGTIRGRPCIEWTKPDKFVYNCNKSDGFAFLRHNGDVIIPASIHTDGGSVPRILWNQSGFSPWTYAPAYLIHDWIYEAHRRGVPVGINSAGIPISYDKEQADWIIAEVIKTQMEHPELYKEEESRTDKSPNRMRRIYWAVSKFGKTAWNQKANPVEEAYLPAVITDAARNLPLIPVLTSLKNELTPLPEKPNMEGSTAPQP